MKTRWLAMLVLLTLIAGSVLFFGACGGDDDDDDDDDVGDDDSGDDDDDTGDDDDDPPEFDGLVSAVGGDEIAVLSWNAATDPSGPITYNIYMAGESGAEDFNVPVESTQELTAEITGLDICVEYFFVVRAQDAAGNEEKNTVEKSAVPVNYDCGYTQADRLAWSYVPPAGRYSVRNVGWIQDVDGDDVPDVLAHAYDSIYTPDDADSTFCISGASSVNGYKIWGAHPFNDHDPTSDSGGNGDNILNAIDDLNDDGIQDVLIGTAWGNRSAFALDGTDGSVLWMFCTYTNPLSLASGWIYDIKPFPDVTEDGVPEAIFGVGSDNDSGWLVNGATGDVLWQMNQSTDAVYCATALPDINNDGYPEAVFGGGDDEDKVFCVESDSTGVATPIWSTSIDVGNNFCIETIGDVDEDGYSDVLVGSWGQRAVTCLSGHTGLKIWKGTTVVDPLRIVALDDVTGDGLPDLAVSSLVRNDALVFNGKTGELFWNENGPANDYQWAIDRIEDINGDGINDVVGGSFDSYVIAYDGTDGTVLWSYDTGGAKVMTIRGTPDMTGDCVPDVVAGTQMLSPSTPGAGEIFLLNGCP